MGRKRYLITVIYSRAKVVKWASSSLVQPALGCKSGGVGEHHFSTPPKCTLRAKTFGEWELGVRYEKEFHLNQSSKQLLPLFNQRCSLHVQKHKSKYNSLLIFFLISFAFNFTHVTYISSKEETTTYLFWDCPKLNFFLMYIYDGPYIYQRCSS